jgi:hypothetical protein
LQTEQWRGMAVEQEQLMVQEHVETLLVVGDDVGILEARGLIGQITAIHHLLAPGP